MKMLLHLFSLLCFSLFPISLSKCNNNNNSDHDILSLAFKEVLGFPPTKGNTCQPVYNISLPSRNLTGSVTWSELGNLSSLQRVNLWNNSLQGSISSSHFWSIPSLERVNLARNKLGGPLRFGPVQRGQSSLKYLKLSQNRFTSTANISNLVALEWLDISHNKVSSVPVGLRNLKKLKHLDLSHNSMHGRILQDLPPLLGLDFLNISYNNFTGEVNETIVKKFGKLAFIKAGNIKFINSSSTNGTSKHQKNHKRTLLLAILIPISAIILSLFLCTVCMLAKRRVKKRELKTTNQAAKDAIALAIEDSEIGWVADAKWTAPVVMIEKPLMQLTFADLAVAASGFGRESQLAERGGRSRPAYRAVLPGDDLHVVIRVIESARDMSDEEAVTAFRNLGQLRHPNILPLLGYCISGREKLLIYEFMERGDLHRWLHELPAGTPNIEEWDDDTGEVAGDWPTRHHIALGIARGLAFLHQGWAGSGRPVTHGHLVPSNILLGDDLEPRISDISPVDNAGTPEGDVYQYGVILFELMTGTNGWDEVSVNRVRGLVKEGKELDLLDERLLIEGVEADWHRQMAGCLHVGYLCTAQSPEKRPTMQQVVGLVKDIRSASVTASSAVS